MLVCIRMSRHVFIKTGPSLAFFAVTTCIVSICRAQIWKCVAVVIMPRSNLPSITFIHHLLFVFQNGVSTCSVGVFFSNCFGMVRLCTKRVMHSVLYIGFGLETGRYLTTYVYMCPVKRCLSVALPCKAYLHWLLYKQPCFWNGAWNSAKVSCFCLSEFWCKTDLLYVLECSVMAFKSLVVCGVWIRSGTPLYSTTSQCTANCSTPAVKASLLAARLVHVHSISVLAVPRVYLVDECRIQESAICDNTITTFSTLFHRDAVYAQYFVSFFNRYVWDMYI